MIRHGRNLFAILLHQVFTYVTMYPGNCTFSYDFCGWTQPVSDPYSSWKRVTDGHNFYLHLRSSYMNEVTVLLESFPVEDTGMQCLTFDFRKSRYGIGNLDVSLVINGFEHQLVRIQKGNYDNVWHRFFLNLQNVQSSVDFKIRLTATVTFGVDMYMDNIQLLKGPCRLKCNFEEDVCGLMISSFRRIGYHDVNPPLPDHTINKVEGHYLYLESIRTTATLENINFFIYEFQCLSFWYWMNGNDPIIKVLVEYIGRTTYLEVWNKSGHQNNTWLPATIEIEVPNQAMTTVRISGVTGMRNSKIRLDDIAITSVSCLDCNFLDGFCNWIRSSGWKISSNGSNYAYPECNSTNESTLISRSEIFPGEKCLSLLHIIETNYKMYIRVWSQEGGRWNLIWDNLSERQITVWTTTHININLAMKSRITISVMHSHGCSDRYFIRSISLKKGRCTETTTYFSATTIISKNDASYTSNRTTTAAISKSTTSTTDATSNNVNGTTTNTTEIANRTNEYGTENTALKMTDQESSSEVSVGVIVGIVIGCLGFAGAVSLVAVYVNRRRQASSNRPKDPRKSTVTNTTYSGMSRTENENKNTMSSMERNKKCNHTSESVYYNAHAEYATIEKKRLRQNQTQHLSGSRDVSVYSLAVSLPDKDWKNVSHAVETDDINCKNVDIESKYHCDTMNETRKTLSDSTYNHTNEFHDDAYDSTIPSTTRPSDETYSHTDFKSTLDSIYTNTSFTDESTHNTTIKSPNQDFEPTYNNTCNVIYDGAHCITQTPTEDADDNYDHTL